MKLWFDVAIGAAVVLTARAGTEVLVDESCIGVQPHVGECTCGLKELGTSRRAGSVAHVMWRTPAPAGTVGVPAAIALPATRRNVAYIMLHKHRRRID